ncbi:MAG TPA: sigma-70 family RNA polymerase sigma factor [Planctomycetes bacterium]|nr:sigma-70 family RNA polymerase sigma factor [Planctomycetota bacterium]
MAPMEAISFRKTSPERSTQAVKEAADDQSLVARAEAGDQEAFAALVHRYADRIYTLVAGMIHDRTAVEDVVQDIFFKVYRKLSAFQGRSSFYTWLYRVSLNTATDHLKKKRRDRHRHVEDPTVLDRPDFTGGPDETMDREELRQKTSEAIASLPTKYRDILLLREYQELSYEEIADVLQCSKGTVESRLFRARARLRSKLEPYLKRG